MNIQTILVLGVLIAAVIGVTAYMIIRKRQGKTGCAGCRWHDGCQIIQRENCPAFGQKNGETS